MDNLRKNRGNSIRFFFLLNFPTSLIDIYCFLQKKVFKWFDAFEIIFRNPCCSISDPVPYEPDWGRYIFGIRAWFGSTFNVVWCPVGYGLHVHFCFKFLGYII